MSDAAVPSTLRHFPLASPYVVSESMLAALVRLPDAARAASALTSFCSGAAHAMLLQTPRGLPTHMSVTCLQHLSPLNVLHAAPLASGSVTGHSAHHPTRRWYSSAARAAAAASCPSQSAHGSHASSSTATNSGGDAHLWQKSTAAPHLAAGIYSRQTWQQCSHPHRSAGFATAAVRLRRQGGQSQQAGNPGGPPPRSEPGSEAVSRWTATTQGNKGGSGADLNGARHPPDQRQPTGGSAAESRAAEQPVASPEGQAAAAAAQMQPDRANSGIQATDWLTENAPWVAHQAPPNDGATWPSDLAWTPERAEGVEAPQRVRMQLEGSLVEVLPLWVCVHQHHDDGEARLYESICPLSEELVARLTCHMEPFCITQDLAFSRCQARAGPWRSYFIGVVGTFAPDEDDVLWPNQVLHGSRTMFNVRNGLDLARFLADPRREDFDSHSANLSRLQAERGYRKAWSWHMLRTRWGDHTLAAFGVDEEDYH